MMPKCETFHSNGQVLANKKYMINYYRFLRLTSRTQFCVKSEKMLQDYLIFPKNDVFLHRIPDPSEKHHGLGECVLEVSGGHVESHSLFHFYIHEERARAGRGAVIGRGRRSGRGQTDEDEHFLSSFNIPNFVNSEDSCVELLLCEPPIISDSQSAAAKSLEPAHRSHDVIQ